MGHQIASSGIAELEIPVKSSWTFQHNPMFIASATTIQLKTRNPSPLDRIHHHKRCFISSGADFFLLPMHFWGVPSTYRHRVPRFSVQSTVERTGPGRMVGTFGMWIVSNLAPSSTARSPL